MKIIINNLEKLPNKNYIYKFQFGKIENRFVFYAMKQTDLLGLNTTENFPLKLSRDKIDSVAVIPIFSAYKSAFNGVGGTG